MIDPEHPETRETELVRPSCRPSKAELEEPIKGTTFDDLVWAVMQPVEVRHTRRPKRERCARVSVLPFLFDFVVSALPGAVSDVGARVGEMACKPGSVLRTPRGGVQRSDGHSSWVSVSTSLVAIHPDGQNVRTRPTKSTPSLPNLAPGGACRAVSVAGVAVRSYRTISPLPMQASAVCFLWRFP